MVIRSLTAAELLQLDPLGDNHFRARHNQHNFMASTFGGQVICQGLAAAQKTVPDWPAHNCSGLFLRAGNPDAPIDYQVDVVRDGRRFAARRVLAFQSGKPIFDLLCSFHDAEGGPHHQADLVTQVPPPESLLNLQQYFAANMDRFPSARMRIYGETFPIELRLIDPDELFFGSERQTERWFWLRMPSAADIRAAADHQSLLAFMSDYWFASVAGASYRSPEGGPSPTVSIASLNHSLWFHDEARADEWLLFVTESPWAGQGRGLARGLVYNRDGVLVVSAAQEVVLNVIPGAQAARTHTEARAEPEQCCS